MMDKESYHRRYPLPERCRDGRLDGCDLVSVSSGSSGSPTIWPRTVTDEMAIARRFEQVFRDGFQAGQRTTLAVVCFPLGTWVGGLFTTACVRHLSAKGYPIWTRNVKRYEIECASIPAAKRTSWIGARGSSTAMSREAMVGSQRAQAPNTIAPAAMGLSRSRVTAPITSSSGADHTRCSASMRGY